MDLYYYKIYLDDNINDKHNHNTNDNNNIINTKGIDS